MSNTETARTIVGIIGNFISFCLFLSPAQTIHAIYRSKSVQEFSPNPYLATLLNCAIWTFYGLPIVSPDNTLIITINSIGLVIELFFVFVFFFYADWQKRRRIITVLFFEAIFLTGVVIISLTWYHTVAARSMHVGIVCIFITIAMYASPLTIMGDVIRTKSVKYMPFYLSLASFLNGSIWMVYALLKFDINVFLPNGMGTVLGAIQLLLYATYYNTTNWNDDEAQIRTNKPLLV